MKKAVVILPTYNEAASIEQVVTGVLANQEYKENRNWDIQVLVVDSESHDKTAEIVRKMQKKYKHTLHLLTTKKEGLGKAYTQGFHHAIDKLKAFVVFEMDADLSHDPTIISTFLRKIEKGSDFVIGSRYMKGGSIPQDWAFHRKLFSVVGNYVIRLGFMNPRVKDWTSGYRCIRSWVVKRVLKKIDVYSGYVFQVAVLDNAVKENAQITEIPIHFVDRKEGVSKINSIQFILQTLTYVFWNSSFIKFGIVGGIGFLIDFKISAILIELLLFKTWVATLISTETAIISNFLLNNFWSFSHKKIDNTKRAFTKGFVKFNLVSSGSIIIQTLGMAILTHLYGKDLWFVYKICIIMLIIIPYSYFSYNRFIWKRK